MKKRKKLLHISFCIDWAAVSCVCSSHSFPSHLFLSSVVRSFLVVLVRVTHWKMKNEWRNYERIVAMVATKQHKKIEEDEKKTTCCFALVCICDGDCECSCVRASEMGRNLMCAIRIDDQRDEAQSRNLKCIFLRFIFVSFGQMRLFCRLNRFQRMKNFVSFRLNSDCSGEYLYAKNFSFWILFRFSTAKL